MRTLLPGECQNLWYQILARWGPIPGYWYPLISQTMPPDVIAFEDAWFYHEVPLDMLK